MKILTRKDVNRELHSYIRQKIIINNYLPNGKLEDFVGPCARPAGLSARCRVNGPRGASGGAKARTEQITGRPRESSNY